MEDAQAIQILPFEETIHEGNKTVFKYFSNITNKNGLISNFAVRGIFEVQNYKIIFSWELAKITLGDEKANYCSNRFSFQVEVQTRSCK